MDTFDLRNNKTCANCGREHSFAALNPRRRPEGLYFECYCHNTLFERNPDWSPKLLEETASA